MVKKATAVKKTGKKPLKKTTKKAAAKAVKKSMLKASPDVTVTKVIADDEIAGTFVGFEKKSEDEEYAWVKPKSGGLEWMMDTESAKKLGLKKGDPVIGKKAFPDSPSRRILKGVRRE